jgi:hypothetical protein
VDAARAGRAVRFVPRGQAQTCICATYPLSRLAEALARFGRRDVVGKLMLVPDPA